MSFLDKNSHSNMLTWLYGLLYPNRRATELITSPVVLSQFCKVHSYSEKIIWHAIIVTKTVSITRVTSLIYRGEIWLVSRKFLYHQKNIYRDSPDPIFRVGCCETNWGEPKRAPHIRDICKFCLSICLSVCSYVHDTIIYKCYSNLRIPSIIDCSFEQYVSQTVL